MVFPAALTLAGAWFAAALNLDARAAASFGVGVLDLLPLAVILATALQNLLFAAGTDACAEPARTASTEAARKAATRIRRRDMSEPFDGRPSPERDATQPRGPSRDTPRSRWRRRARCASPRPAPRGSGRSRSHWWYRGSWRRSSSRCRSAA